MTHSPDHAERAAIVAAGLTKAQREAVLKRVQSWNGALQGCTSWTEAGRPLLDADVIAFAPDPRSSETHFTPFGLAVRAALNDEGKATPPSAS